jgi:hypothetical protein
MSDLYLMYQRGTFYRSGQMRPRPAGGEPPYAGYEITEGSYRCVEWSLSHLIDDTMRANADQPADPDLAGMRFLQTQALSQRDSLWSQKFFTSGVWTTSLAGVASAPGAGQFLQFDQSGSTPIETIRGQRIAIQSGTGYTPNVAVFGALAHEAFLLHPEVAERVKYTQTAAGFFGNEDAAIAALLGVDKVLVARGVQNSAAENQPDDIGFIADERSVLLCYTSAAPSILEPSGGYQFAWTGLIPGVDNAYGGVIMRGRKELAHSDVLQIRGSYDQRLVAPDLGAFFSGAVSATYAG